MVLGAGVAAVLLILFTGIVATLMKLPYLKLVGGLALFWVAIKLVVPQAHDDEDTPEAVERPVARGARRRRRQHRHEPRQRDRGRGGGEGQLSLLLGLGLAISIPLIVAGSALFLALLERFPVVVWAGGALLGWIAGGLIARATRSSQDIWRARRWRSRPPTRVRHVRPR